MPWPCGAGLVAGVSSANAAEVAAMPPAMMMAAASGVILHDIVILLFEQAFVGTRYQVVGSRLRLGELDDPQVWLQRLPALREALPALVVGHAPPNDDRLSRIPMPRG